MSAMPFQSQKFVCSSDLPPSYGLTTHLRDDAQAVDATPKSEHDEGTSVQGAISRYTRAAVPLYSAVFSCGDASAVMRLNAFHSSV